MKYSFASTTANDECAVSLVVSFFRQAVFAFHKKRWINASRGKLLVVNEPESRRNDDVSCDEERALQPIALAIKEQERCDEQGHDQELDLEELEVEVQWLVESPSNEHGDWDH